MIPWQNSWVEASKALCLLDQLLDRSKECSDTLVEMSRREWRDHKRSAKGNHERMNEGDVEETRIVDARDTDPSLRD